MVRVGDGVNVYGVVVGRRVVCKCQNGLGPGRGRREVKGVVDSRVGPYKTSGNAKWWEGGGEKGGERSGDGDRGGIKGGGVMGGERVQEGSRGKLGQSNSECFPILGDRELDRGNSKHVMEWFNRGGMKGAADLANGDVLCDL